ncbi:DUF1573 domain-containing protein [Nafulsella turpanensis]|uniref:DUF1573 domain-containing protein n=1 Tax=Nafulsella turpanensis TaxID=1265690 RepID=UPI000349A69C|nr:DUF1573 domain-containing protein [Nafulsella turpanensis]
MKKISVCLLFALMVTTLTPEAGAQQIVEREGFEKKLARVEFPEKIHDFGVVPEQEGPVQHTFEFTNTGEVPVKILAVQASCGCTTPDWTKEEVAPGEKGIVVAEYNPMNRPGVFNKSLTVTTSADPNVVILTIKGTVKPRPRTAEDDFPAALGNLRVKYRGFNMGKVTTEAPVTKVFEVYNQGEEPLVFKEEFTAPEHIKVSFRPKEIAPKGRGEVMLTYDVKARNELGWVSDNLELFTNEAEPHNKKVFSVMATIEEYFPPMTEEEIVQAPRLQLDKTVHEFGKVNEGKLVETTFQITNTGKQPLNIRKTKANCGCTVSAPEKDTLAPGESSNIKVTFDTKGRRGNQYKTVTIFSNDPLAPTQTVTLKGEVVE